MKKFPDDREPSSTPSKLSAWDARLIEVITDCEDDTKRYRNIINQINGEPDCTASILAYCMKNEAMHRHLTLLTALHIVRSRFERACEAAGVDNENLIGATTALRQNIELIDALLKAMFRQIKDRINQPDAPWDYATTLLAHLTERRLQLAIDETVAALQQQFACTLITVLMTEIEPAMKSVQDRLSLRPELPLDVKAFAGAMLGLKTDCNRGAPLALDDLASDISRIFRIPRTICLSA